MITRRANKSTDPAELLLAGETPEYSEQAWMAALGLYFFHDAGQLSPEAKDHIRNVMDEWWPLQLEARGRAADRGGATAK